MKSESNPSLLEKHVVITGGGSGIGAAIADQMAELGVCITLMGRNQERLLRKAEELPKATAVAVDITQPKEVETAFAIATQNFGTVDILINNAGTAQSSPFMKMNTHHWEEMLSVNLMGAFYCTQICLGGMKQQKWGRLIFIASTAGLKGYAYVAAYCAAKHGVIGMMKSLALETIKEGITVNAVCPGYTETDLMKNTLHNITQKTGRSYEFAQAELVASNPQKRFIQPQEVANAVAWLCHPNAGAITGQSIAVAGGEVMG